jgi:serine/threonine protein kinase
MRFRNETGSATKRSPAGVSTPGWLAGAVERDFTADVSAALADRYAIERELGSGGMATVYLGLDLKHRRDVAIKVLRPDLAATIAGDRFIREVEIAARLQHPHIVGVLDSGRVGDVLYYVMPYVPGESLRGRLSRHGELPLGEGIRILRGIVEALAYAHYEGVVHRDIKPENVLIIESGGRGPSRLHAMVADFGVAKALTDSAAAAHSNVTSAGIAVGTPAYMAPEQGAADPNIDHRCDIYSVGIVAYEMFVGRPPFSGITPQQTIAAHITQTPDPLSRMRPAVPVAIETLVMRCLEKRPADRWQSAEDMLAHLDHVSASSATAAVTARPTADVVEGSFRLSERVCRRLNRKTLDPRVIGGEMRYADNRIGSDTLVCYIHGIGQDHSLFAEVLAGSQYHAVSPTMFGFEPAARQRIPLSFDDHATLLREFLRSVIVRDKPRHVILVGFSSGADLGFEILTAAVEDPIHVDAFITLGANLSVETCFASKVFARMHSGDERAVLSDLTAMGLAAHTINEWLNVHEYLVETVRKFRSNAAPLRSFAADLYARFENEGTSQFVTWFRAASSRVKVLRCVFEDNDACNRIVHDLRLRNLDDGLLGDQYRPEALVIEEGADHFALRDEDRLSGHVEAVLGELGR